MSEVYLKVLIEIAHIFFLINLQKMAPTKCINIPFSQNKELDKYIVLSSLHILSTYT